MYKFKIPGGEEKTKPIQFPPPNFQFIDVFKKKFLPAAAVLYWGGDGQKLVQSIRFMTKFKFQGGNTNKTIRYNSPFNFQLTGVQKLIVFVCWSLKIKQFSPPAAGGS